MNTKTFIHPVIPIIELERTWDDDTDYWSIWVGEEDTGSRYSGDGTENHDFLLAVAERFLFEERSGGLWTLRTLINKMIAQDDWDTALWLIEGRGYYRGINAEKYAENPVPYSKAFPRDLFFNEKNYCVEF